MILQAVNQRNKNFPDEPGAVTIALVLMNIGRRFTKVRCIEREWSGILQDIPKGEGVPKCPNGHALFEQRGLELGWIDESGGKRPPKSDEEPFAFTRQEDGTISLESAVFQALGAASYCWDNVEAAGVFDSTRAAQIGEILLREILSR